MRHDIERNEQLVDTLHGLDEQGLDGLGLLLGRLDEQFVMDLQQQPRGGRLGPETLIETDHRQLDQVRRGALDDAVHRRTLGEGAPAGVAALDLRQGADPAEERARFVPLVVASRGDEPVDRLSDAGQCWRSSVSMMRLGLACVGMPSRCDEAVGAHAVEDAEVDLLGSAPVAGPR